MSKQAFLTLPKQTLLLVHNTTMLKPNYVFVIDTHKKPLMPCKPSVARKLLTAGKAAVFRMYPFTIILKKVVGDVNTELELKIDPGSKTTGLAVLAGENVIFCAELAHRGLAISAALTNRKAVRRARRNRNTRYRPARFKHRVRPDGWLAPSLQHRIDTTMTIVNKLIRFVPIKSIAQELVRFDLQQMENPEISGIEYQQGELLGYEVREYLLNKWERKCTYCGVENTPLQIEHIQPKSKGGSNRISNLCLACEKCNQQKGILSIDVFLESKPDLLHRIKLRAKAPLKDAAAVNSTRWGLYHRLKLTGLTVSTGSGGRTKFNRMGLALPKTHWVDAACVGEVQGLNILANQPLNIKAVGNGTRRRVRMDKYGFPASKPRQSYDIPWRTGDIAVTTDGIKGRVVIQSAKRLEVRVDGKRYGGKLSEFKKVHSMDMYSYM